MSFICTDLFHMEVLDIAAIVGAAATTTGAALIWLLSASKRALVDAQLPANEPEPAISFLFEGESLQHASETASKLYQLMPDSENWSDIRAKLLTRFPQLPASVSAAETGEFVLPAREAEDAGTLCVKREGSYTHVNVIEGYAQNSSHAGRIKGLQQELENLRRASDTTSHAIWQIDASGRVIWFNTAYRELYEKLYLTEPDAAKPVFELATDVEHSGDQQRVSARNSEGEHHDWYDVSSFSLSEVTVFHAEDVNAVVKSEVAQRNFVQTLAKTFAQLSIGLAIFDRNGQLALFNPALIDLTALPADFLSGRPTLLSFFDRIRENRRMPEPKNYHSWRQEISEVIAAATDGRYQETWTLESGQTYRVNGRPHPDGAIAFLIEDISAEISLTRNFRAELELGQSLMDTFEEGLVVFSSTGILTFSNRAYREMWGLDPDNSFTDITISDCIQDWNDRCKSDASWSALTEFVLDYGAKTSWEMSASLLSGEPLLCTVSRIASGATIIRFSHVARAPLAKPKAQPEKV